MKLPFGASEQLIYEFEQLLNDNGLKINTNSDLERISIAVLETNAKYKKEVVHDNSQDIRYVFSDTAGLVDFVSQIVKHKTHKGFPGLIPHLELLNTSSPVLTTKSKVTDDGNNKLFELYIALLIMAFSNDVDLDDPNNSKGDNPDILFSYNGEQWAIACKALHADKERTLYDNILKGTDQINRSSAVKGMVVVNLKNILDRDKIWPITNKDRVAIGEEPEFGCFSSPDIPWGILRDYGTDFQRRLHDTIGADNFNALSVAGKCPQGFLIFLHALTAVEHEGKCPAAILKTLNLVQLNAVAKIYHDLARDLNESMYNRM